MQIRQTRSYSFGRVEERRAKKAEKRPSSSVMADRRAELEKKKQKLALIRAQKENSRRRSEQPAPSVGVRFSCAFIRIALDADLVGSSPV